MKVKELKDLLENIPEDLDVMICANGENFEFPLIASSGKIKFGQPCNELGEPIAGTEGPEVFALISKDFAEQD